MTFELCETVNIYGHMIQEGRLDDGQILMLTFDPYTRYYS